MDSFAKSYAFLEDYRASELEALKQESNNLKKRGSKRRRASDESRKLEVEDELRRRTHQDKQRKHLGEFREAELAVKRQEHEKVRTTGKKPYFHRKAAVREMVRETRKKTKGRSLRDKESERREKKVAAREKRRLPARR